MFGGLPQIAENLGKAISSPVKGNLAGMGLMMEGLDYNPVVYEFVTDLMWETGIPDLKSWERGYLQSQHGSIHEEIIDAWDSLFNYYYTQSGIFERNN